MSAKKAVQRHGFKTGEHVVYPAHGVGQIMSIEEQEIAGFKLELFVVTFDQEKMTLRVPTAKAASDRLAREIAAVHRTGHDETLKLMESFLQKGPRRGPKLEAEEAQDEAA